MTSTETPAPKIIGTTGEKDVPPRRGKTVPPRPANGKTPSAIPAYKPGAIAAGMTELYTKIGMMVGMFDPHCGGVVVENAEKMATSLERAAEKNPALRSVIGKVLDTSVIGELIAAHAPVVAMVAMHHIPAVRNRFTPAPAPSDTPVYDTVNAEHVH